MQGRWTVTTSPHGERTLPVTVIEIAPCDPARLCGRLVRDGCCGPVVLRGRIVLNDRLFSTLTIRRTDVNAILYRKDGSLVIAADPPETAHLKRQGLPLVGHFRCDEGGLCGRVQPDGVCGEVVLHLNLDAAGRTRGTVTISGRPMAATASQEDGELVIRAFPAANPLSRRILPVVSTFRREGPARCAEGVS